MFQVQDPLENLKKRDNKLEQLSLSSLLILPHIPPNSILSDISSSLLNSTSEFASTTSRISVFQPQPLTLYQYVSLGQFGSLPITFVNENSFSLSTLLVSFMILNTSSCLLGISSVLTKQTLHLPNFSSASFPKTSHLYKSVVPERFTALLPWSNQCFIKNHLDLLYIAVFTKIGLMIAFLTTFSTCPAISSELCTPGFCFCTYFGIVPLFITPAEGNTCVNQRL